MLAKEKGDNEVVHIVDAEKVEEKKVSKKEAKNLPAAKQTIDLIGMLKEKTKGNLTPDEDKFLESVLFDLRMRYVKAAE